MSLNYDSTKCNPPTPTSDSDTTLRETLIFSSITVKMGEITNDNYKEFFARVKMAELVFGAFRVSQSGPVYMQEEEVKRWIGLKTNVITETRAKFLAVLSKDMNYQISRIAGK